jgi:HSP20 family protein
MLNRKKQDNQDVFEMILKTTDNGSVFDSSGHSLNDSMTTNFDDEMSQNWHENHQEGQLTVDVINKDKELIIVSTMAGSDGNKIEVFVHNDLLTIRGERVMPIKLTEEMSYIHQESYWGKFSRTIVLPVDVKGDKTKAEYKNGVLVVKIPKGRADSKVSVKIVDD